MERSPAVLAPAPDVSIDPVSPLATGVVLIVAVLAVAGLLRAGWHRTALILATLAVLYPLCGAEFSWWDDQLTIHQNPLINNPGIGTLQFYWAHFKDGLYVPVTYTVWAALAKMAYVGDPGMDGIFINSWFFHSTNVLIHLGSTLFVLNILKRLVGRTDAAIVGAMLFGLHPVQVETIGWSSGLKDLLCWFFALATVHLYVRRVQSIQADGTRLWASREMPLCMLLLILGILSKPTCMVTPVALLVIDGLLLRRQWVRPAIELLPLFAISGVGAVVARLAQHTDTVEKAALWHRPFIVGDNIVFYFGKILWPARLCIDYGRSVDAVTSSPLLYVKWIIPAALAVLAIRWHRHRPMLAAGLALFFIGFAPVCGLATFQMQNISFTTDHYLYFSMLGISLLLAWGVSLRPQRSTFILATLILIALGVRSHVQTGIWKDNTALFAGTIKANPNSAIARNNLAAMYMGGLTPRPDLAVPLLKESVALRPKLYYAWANLGRAQAVLGHPEEGLQSLQEAWRLMEEAEAGGEARGDLAYSIAMQWETLEKLDKALEWTEKAEYWSPNDHHTRQLIARLKSKAATRPSTAPSTTLPASSGEVLTAHPAPAAG